LKHLRLALPIVILLLSAEPARATTVAIVWPPTRSDEVNQVLTLLRGELLSAGLDIAMAERSGIRAGGDGQAWLEGFAARGTSAVVDVIGNDALEALDVWILKAPPQRFEVTRVALEPEAPNQPAMLALRAFEALRAGLVQMDWAARKPRDKPVAKQPAVTVATEVAAKPVPYRQRVGVEVGAVASTSLDGVGIAVSPTVCVGWAVHPSLLIQAAAEGFGSRASISTETGGAKVAQQYAILGASYRLRRAHRLWPFFGLAAGVLHTSVEGEAGWGTGARSAAQWSGLIDAGVGVGGDIYQRLYMTLSLHAQLAEPYVAIHITDKAVTSGRPNLLLALTIGAWL